MYTTLLNAMERVDIILVLAFWNVMTYDALELPNNITLIIVIDVIDNLRILQQSGIVTAPEYDVIASTGLTIVEIG